MKKYLFSIFFLSLLMFYAINNNSAGLKEKLGFVEKKEIFKSGSEPQLKFVRAENIVPDSRPAVICIKVDRCYYCRKATKVI